MALARDLGFLADERWGELEALRDHAARLTWGLYQAISRRQKTDGRPSGRRTGAS
jgi:hypothetical protein